MTFRHSVLHLFIIAALPLYTWAETPLTSVDNSVEFNDQFLMNTGSKIDVSRYAHGNPVAPGIYNVSININGKPNTTSNVTFKDNGTPQASPCLTAIQLRQWGIDTSSLPDDVVTAEPDSCVEMPTYYQGSAIAFDSSKQALDITMPQVFLLRLPRGYVDRSLWDNGIPVAMLSYDLNGYHSTNDGDTSDTGYAGLHYGANVGPWRFRARGGMNWSSDDGADYSSQDMYLQRDIETLNAQFVAGDAWTRGDAFDAINLRGVRMYNDDRMLPGGLSTYAPVIRGVANSNAKVTVSQSGSKIYETTVPPGAFVIDDLSTTGYGADLDVTIEESDGSKRSFSVPYSSVTQMLRPGFSRWEVGAGKLNDDNLHSKPGVATATWYYGLNNTFTGYMGGEYMDEGYYAGLVGLAMNTAIGAFAFDVTHSQAKIDSLPRLTGESYRLSFSKLVEATDTSFNVAAYRFSTKNYLSLSDAASLDDQIKHRDEDRYAGGDDVYGAYQRMKNQVQVNISQTLGDSEAQYGSLYVTGSWENYWDNSGSTEQYSTGYSNAFSWASYSLFLQRSYDENGQKDDSINLSLSIPLSSLMPNHQRPLGFSTLNTNMTNDFKGSNNLNVTASGNSDNNLYSYSVSTSSNYTDHAATNQVSGFGNYNGAYGPLSLSVSASDDNSQQYSASYSGGMLLHSGGLTLAPGSIGDSDTLALVKAEGAKGARLTSGAGEIGNSGYAVMPYLSAYRQNTVGLDISTLDADVEIKNTSSVVVPHSGAVVEVTFATDQGRSVLMEIQRADNGFIPLGADVLDQNNQIVGSVGQAGQAFVRGVDDSGTLKIVWGNQAHQYCLIHYQIQDDTPKVGFSSHLSGLMCQTPDNNIANSKEPQ